MTVVSEAILWFVSGTSEWQLVMQCCEDCIQLLIEKLLCVTSYHIYPHNSFLGFRILHATWNTQRQKPCWMGTPLRIGILNSLMTTLIKSPWIEKLASFMLDDIFTWVEAKCVCVRGGTRKWLITWSVFGVLQHITNHWPEHSISSSLWEGRIKKLIHLTRLICWHIKHQCKHSKAAGSIE